MNREKAWVWFKGGLKGGSWVGGFVATKSEEGGYIVERSDFVKCRLPEWRISLVEPENNDKGPKLPEEAVWKYY